MEEGELIWITMKSQRVYIGMIHSATFDSTRSDISNLVLIPMLSGYRDRETLDLRVEHNYSAWYDSHDITLQAGEKSALAYRKVILLNQIESLSLLETKQNGKTQHQHNRRLDAEKAPVHKRHLVVIVVAAGPCRERVQQRGDSKQPQP